MKKRYQLEVTMRGLTLSSYSPQFYQAFSHYGRPVIRHEHANDEWRMEWGEYDDDLPIEDDGDWEDEYERSEFDD